VSRLGAQTEGEEYDVLRKVRKEGDEKYSLNLERARMTGLYIQRRGGLAGLLLIEEVKQEGSLPRASRGGGPLLAFILSNLFRP